jgi:hypothetical protein
MTMKVFAVACMAAVCGCAGLVRETREPAVERLDGSGVRSRTLLVQGGDVLRLVNADARPHQIYSNDCGEVSSTLLNPGDIYVARIGAGPKVCHFEDLLSPLDAGYSGTVQVHALEPRFPEPVDG